MLPLLFTLTATASPLMHAWPSVLEPGPDGTVDVIAGATWSRRTLPDTFVRESGPLDGNTLAGVHGAWHFERRGPLTWTPTGSAPVLFPLDEDLRAAVVEGDTLWIATDKALRRLPYGPTVHVDGNPRGLAAVSGGVAYVRGETLTVIDDDGKVGCTAPFAGSSAVQLVGDTKGRFLASADGSAVVLWDAQRCTALVVAPVKARGLAFVGDALIALGPDGSLVQLRLPDLVADGAPADATRVWDVLVAGDTLALYSPGLVWNPVTGQATRLEAGTVVVHDPDRLVSLRDDAIIVRDATGRTLRTAPRGALLHVKAVAVLGDELAVTDGLELVWLGPDGAVTRWRADAATSERTASLKLAAPGLVVAGAAWKVDARGASPTLEPTALSGAQPDRVPQPFVARATDAATRFGLRFVAAGVQAFDAVAGVDVGVPWASPHPSTPMVRKAWINDDGTEAVVVTGDTVRAFTPADGRERWQVPVTSGELTVRFDGPYVVVRWGAPDPISWRVIDRVDGTVVGSIEGDIDGVTDRDGRSTTEVARAFSKRTPQFVAFVTPAPGRPTLDLLRLLDALSWLDVSRIQEFRDPNCNRAAQLAAAIESVPLLRDRYAALLAARCAVPERPALAPVAVDWSARAGTAAVVPAPRTLKPGKNVAGWLGIDQLYQGDVSLPVVAGAPTLILRGTWDEVIAPMREAWLPDDVALVWVPPTLLGGDDVRPDHADFWMGRERSVSVLDPEDQDTARLPLQPAVLVSGDGHVLTSGAVLDVLPDAAWAGVAPYFPSVVSPTPPIWAYALPDGAERAEALGDGVIVYARDAYAVLDAEGALRWSEASTSRASPEILRWSGGADAMGRYVFEQVGPAVRARDAIDGHTVWERAGDWAEGMASAVLIHTTAAELPTTAVDPTTAALLWQAPGRWNASGADRVGFGVSGWICEREARSGAPAGCVTAPVYDERYGLSGVPLVIAGLQVADEDDGRLVARDASGAEVWARTGVVDARRIDAAVPEQQRLLARLGGPGGPWATLDAKGRVLQVFGFGALAALSPNRILLLQGTQLLAWKL